MKCGFQLGALALIFLFIIIWYSTEIDEWFSIMGFYFINTYRTASNKSYDKIYHQYIVSQLNLFSDTRRLFNESKSILQPHGISPQKIVIYGVHKPSIRRSSHSCPISNCVLIDDRSKWREADILLITDNNFPTEIRPTNQTWVLYMHEPPPKSYITGVLRDYINYTATYRMDSTIQTVYGEYIPNDPTHGADTHYPVPKENYAMNKTKLVAWFVSNCNAFSPRMQYAEELRKHIAVDVYGKCGNLRCDRSTKFDCFQMLKKEYKFYLSFENSLCQDYITEKFFEIALTYNIVPVVMGASIDEYKRVSPPHSFIHVDEFSSPSDLAQYLLYLNSNDTAYSSYFAWHNHGRVELWKHKNNCYLCALAHLKHRFKPFWYPDVADWWNSGCQDRVLRWNPFKSHIVD